MRKGWFRIDGSQDGDRSLTEQMTGLRPLIHEVRGKTVLDVGCAEGLISISLTSVGATSVHGIEVVPDHVKVANALKNGRPCTFEVADANTWIPPRRYDIVLMLALLHKLRDPAAACQKFADAAIETCVIRLPPVGAEPKAIGGRGPCSIAMIGSVMHRCGFKNTDVQDGPRGEWTAYFKRQA